MWNNVPPAPKPLADWAAILPNRSIPESYQAKQENVSGNVDT